MKISEDVASGNTVAFLPGETHPEVSKQDQLDHIKKIQADVMSFMLSNLKNKVYQSKA